MIIGTRVRRGVLRQAEVGTNGILQDIIVVLNADCEHLVGLAKMIVHSLDPETT